MRVILVFLCIFAVFLSHIFMQHIDSKSTTAKGYNIDTVTACKHHFACAVAAFAHVFGISIIPMQYDQNVNETVTDAAIVLKEKCSNYMTLKVLCLTVISVFAIWKIILRSERPIGPIVTENVKLQKEMEIATANHLRSILDAIGVGVVATDTQMKIAFINSTAGDMCGFCPKSAIGKLIGDVVRFKDKNCKFTAYNVLQNIKGNHPVSEDIALELQSHDGRYLDVQQKITPLLLGDRVGAVILLLDVTASRDVIRKLSYSASHDALTGLHNRASFEKCLQNAAINSEERNLQHAIVFVDLDGFKKINDESGHAAGDELLKRIAKLMQSQVRHSDFVARLGGDEFGLILFNCEPSRAKILMSKLVHSIMEYSFCWEGEVKHVGASAGITKVDSHKSVSTLLAKADAACYAAKRRGKGQVCVFEGY